MDTHKSMKERIEKILSREQEKIQLEEEKRNAEMKEVEAHELRFRELSKHCYFDLIEPRLRSLESYFNDALYHSPRFGEMGAVEFNRHRRFDASVTLELGIEPDYDFKNLIVKYHLHIIPILMDFQDEDFLSFPIDNVDENHLISFVEEKITQCVETYIRLQENPSYHKHIMSTDPVCHKVVDCDFATAYAVYQEKKYYFCSTTCRDQFLDNPERYS